MICVGDLFFKGIELKDGNRGMYNGIEFHVNEVKTHFEASSIMDQCSKMMGLVDKKGYSSRNWTVFMYGKNGRIPSESFYETKGPRGKLLRWVEYGRLLPILTYSMGDGNAVNEFLMNREWIDKTGHVYLLRTVINGEVIMKYGRACDLDQRMSAYKHGCDSYKKIASCPVDDMFDVEKKIGEYLYTHGAVRHSKGDEWFTYGRVVGNADCDTAVENWMDALNKIDPNLMEKVVGYEEYM